MGPPRGCALPRVAAPTEPVAAMRRTHPRDASSRAPGRPAAPEALAVRPVRPARRRRPADESRRSTRPTPQRKPRRVCVTLVTALIDPSDLRIRSDTTARPAGRACLRPLRVVAEAPIGQANGRPEASRRRSRETGGPPSPCRSSHVLTGLKAEPGPSAPTLDLDPGCAPWSGALTGRRQRLVVGELHGPAGGGPRGAEKGHRVDREVRSPGWRWDETETPLRRTDEVAGRRGPDRAASIRRRGTSSGVTSRVT